MKEKHHLPQAQNVADDSQQPRDVPTCQRRGACCRNNPGWFGPGEVEKAAEFLELDVGEFVNKYVILDQVKIGGLRVEAFAPVKVDETTREPLQQPGGRVSRIYHLMNGPCVFFDTETPACGIHGARPIECSHYLCTQAEKLNLTKVQIGQMWLDVAGEPTT